MTTSRRLLALLACVTVAAACDAPPETPPPTDDDTRSGALVASLPDACATLGTPSPDGEITFVAGDRLYAATERGDVRCLLDGATGPIRWGPAGDRVLLGNTAITAGERRTSTVAITESVGWTRPEGTSLVGTAGGGRHILKVPAGGGREVNASFLARHDALAYHPAGLHFAASGEEDDGTYGLYLAQNDGSDARLLARGETARRITSIAFGRRGRTLYFVADHGHAYHLHRLDLRTRAGRIDDGRLATLDAGTEPIEEVAVSEFPGDRIAYRVGSCDGAGEVRVLIGEDSFTVDVPASARPVGWLRSGVLVLAEHASGCEGPARLLLWTPPATSVLVEEVDHVAVRVRLPRAPAPAPPPEDGEVVA